MIQVVQNLASISVNTDDISVFHYFKDLIQKNFSKVLGKKYKIFSFFEESEIPQRKYFLKLLQKRCADEKSGVCSLAQSYNKTFKLNFKQENTLKPVILVEVEFDEAGILLRLNANDKLFVHYVKQYFKEHGCEYNPASQILIVPYKNASTTTLFESFASANEHLKYCVDFSIDEDEYKAFKHKMKRKQSEKWKFNALTKLFSSYFQTLQCTPDCNLNQIRQKYLILVKLYHPDSHHGKSHSEMAYNREQFEKIQIAYDNLKALYKNNA